MIANAFDTQPQGCLLECLLIGSLLLQCRCVRLHHVEVEQWNAASRISYSAIAIVFACRDILDDYFTHGAPSAAPFSGLSSKWCCLVMDRQ